MSLLDAVTVVHKDITFDQETRSVIQAIPTEIWSECWSERYCNRNDLHQISRTCWLFRHICLHLLFRRLQNCSPDPSEVQQEFWRFDKRTLEKSIKRFEVLAGDPSLSRLRSWVQSWEFWGERYLAGCWRLCRDKEQVLQDLYTLGKGAFVTGLPAYHNLKSLKLYEIRIGNTFRKTLERLPTLETLIIEGCKCRCSAGPPLPLKVFRVKRNDGPSILRVSPDTLISVSITDMHEEYISHLNALGPLINLTHLEVEVRRGSDEGFFQLLIHCPQLTSLVIAPTSSLPILSQNLPPTAVPLLSSYVGPMCLVEFFIQGRTLQHIAFNDKHCIAPESLNATLAQISLWNPTLKSLVIPCSPLGPEILFTVHSAFGTYLRKLEITFDKSAPNSQQYISPPTVPQNNVATIFPPVQMDDSLMDSDDPHSENGSHPDTESTQYFESDDNDSEYDSNDDYREVRSISDGEVRRRERTQLSYKMQPKSPFEPFPGISLPRQTQNWDEADLPPISVDENGLPTNDPHNTIQGLMDSIVLGHVPLPSALTNLRFVYCDSCRDSYSPEITLEYWKQQPLVRRLFLLYPDLQEMVIFNRENIWEINDHLWRSVYWPKRMQYEDQYF